MWQKSRNAYKKDNRFPRCSSFGQNTLKIDCSIVKNSNFHEWLSCFIDRKISALDFPLCIRSNIENMYLDQLPSRFEVFSFEKYVQFALCQLFEVCRVFKWRLPSWMMNMNSSLCANFSKSGECSNGVYHYDRCRSVESSRMKKNYFVMYLLIR